VLGPLDLILLPILIHLPPPGVATALMDKEEKRPARPEAGGAFLRDYSRDSAKAGPLRQGARGAAARPMARTLV
jgi:hypothetical protein